MAVMPDADDWSYSGNPGASDLDGVRFYLQDTDSDVRLLSNSEIGYLLSVWKDTYNGSLIWVAHVAAEIIAAKFTGVVTVNADGVAVDLSNVAPAYATLATQLEALYEQEQIGGEVDLTNLMWAHAYDFSIAPLRFAVGLDDNPLVGLQDYGGLTGFGSLWWEALDLPYDPVF